MKIAVELPKRPAILKGLKPDERVKLDTLHYRRADSQFYKNARHLQTGYVENILKEL